MSDNPVDVLVDICRRMACSFAEGEAAAKRLAEALAPMRAYLEEEVDVEAESQ